MTEPNEALGEPFDKSLDRALAALGWRLPHTVDETAEAERWIFTQRVDVPPALGEKSIVELADSKSRTDSRPRPVQSKDEHSHENDQDRDHGMDR